MVALTSCMHGASGGDCGCDDEPSVFENAMYSAPYRDRLPDGTLGADYLPVSHITGRSVSQAVAEAEYRTSRDAVPSAKGAGAGGMWDYERAVESNHRQRRDDQRAGNMAAELVLVTRYITTHPNMPRRLVCAAVCYWEHSMSVAQVGDALKVSRATAWDYIKDVRRLIHPRGAKTG